MRPKYSVVAGSYPDLNNITMQIEEGTVPTDYSPYNVQNLTIPTDYELCSAGTAYDAQRFFTENGKTYRETTQRIGKVDMSALNWARASGASSPSTYIFRANIPNMKIREKNTKHNALCVGYSSYSNHSFVNEITNMEIVVATSSTNLYLRNDTYDNDLVAFINSLAGQTLYYELAEPIVTTIEMPADFENNTECEGNGTITFKNTLGEDYRVPIPNEVEYIVKVSEAL